ncbi:ATP-binding cassette domain-containing protein, partial [Caulobacter sp.]
MLRAVLIQELAISRGERRLFSGLNLTLRAGEAAVLVGRNGAGKTSLLRAVAGLLRPAEGSIAFETAEGPIEADTARAEQLHMLGHQDGLKSSRTAWEELRFQT